MTPYRLMFPLLRLLSPERAHGLALWTLRWRLVPGASRAPTPALAQTVFGRDFPNPVGVAAGFDKDATAVEGCLRLGAGFVEVGTVTPRPQPGNPRPRLFRLVRDQGIINRMGFNNGGMAAMAARLRARQGRPGVVGVNLGRNKDSVEAVPDYVAGVETLGPLADYLVINVSSPNTPGLRALQDRASLETLVAAVATVRDALPARPPLLLKIAPDLTADDRADIAAVALAGGLDGLICTNTTVSRPDSLQGRHRAEGGGLSGRPLAPLATDVLADLYRLTAGRVPLIGVGGIDSAAEAYARIRAGATLVQVYSALVFEGPGLIAHIRNELQRLLKIDGFTHIREAVGVDAAR